MKIKFQDQIAAPPHNYIIAYAKEMYDLPCDVDTELLKLRQIRTAFDLTFLFRESTVCRGGKRYR